MADGDKRFPPVMPRPLNWGVVALVIARFFLADTALAEGGAGSGGGGPPMDQKGPEQAMPLDAYEMALKSLQKGDCTKGEEILGPLVRQNQGYAVAELDIGYCYVQKASQTAEAGEGLKLKEIALGWFLRAANAGQRRAQEELVRQYLAGDVLLPDPREAGKWYLLWKANHGSFYAAPTASEDQLEQKVKSTLTEADWEAARARAKIW